MLSVVGQILPLALAVALSSVPITATLTILLSPAGSGSALAFMIGWLVGLFGVVAIFAFALRAVPPPDEAPSAQPAIGIAEIVIGVGLVGYAVVRFIQRRPARLAQLAASEGSDAGTPEALDPGVPDPDLPDPELPRWLRAVGTLKPWPALGLGIILNLRPKALLLAIAAGLIIGPSGLGAGETTIVLLIFLVLGGSTVAVPVILSLARPALMQRPLRAAESWIVRNSGTVTLIVMLIVGTVVLGDGLTRL
jgi:hypothetical protein